MCMHVNVIAKIDYHATVAYVLLSLEIEIF